VPTLAHKQPLPKPAKRCSCLVPPEFYRWVHADFNKNLRNQLRFYKDSNRAVVNTTTGISCQADG
jgi:hypothetical protein